MEQVLAENECLSASEIADEINRRKLYTRKKDDLPVPPSQISARANNYPYLFVRDAGEIRLRRTSPNKTLPQAPKGVSVSATSALHNVTFWDLGTIGDLIKCGLPSDKRLDQCGVYKLTVPAQYVPRFIPPDAARENGNVITPWDLASLESKWVSKTDTVYIGLAGDRTPRSLHKRLDELLEHAQGHTTDRGPHKGGEIVWQLRDYHQFHLWAAQSDDPPTPRETEKTLLRQFVEAHGKLPFANRRSGSATRDPPPAKSFKPAIVIASLVGLFAGAWLYNKRKD
jgi:hypothetical protein